MKKIRWGLFQDWIFLLFLAGSICGCVTANLLGGELLRQIGCFDSVYNLDRNLGLKEKGELWCYVLKRRITEFGLGSLVGMTAFASAASCGLAVCLGFGCGLLLSVFTMQYGWRGLAWFLRVMLPHWPFYMTAWAGLALGAANGLEKMKVRGWLVFMALILAGTAAEAFVNPLFLLGI